MEEHVNEEPFGHFNLLLLGAIGSRVILRVGPDFAELVKRSEEVALKHWLYLVNDHLSGLLGSLTINFVHGLQGLVGQEDRAQQLINS